jgi:hypothetical protein
MYSTVFFILFLQARVHSLMALNNTGSGTPLLVFILGILLRGFYLAFKSKAEIFL